MLVLITVKFIGLRNMSSDVNVVQAFLPSGVLHPTLHSFRMQAAVGDLDTPEVLL